MSCGVNLRQKPAYLEYNDMEFPLNIVLAMGSHLQSPDNGDGVFEMKSQKQEIQKLYSWKSVLTTRCDYYNTSKHSLS